MLLKNSIIAMLVMCAYTSKEIASRYLHTSSPMLHIINHTSRHHPLTFSVFPEYADGTKKNKRQSYTALMFTACVSWHKQVSSFYIYPLVVMSL